MSHFGDYMDGVPVKISEKYKRPPTIELPYSVNECAARAQAVVETVDYCSTFEQNVLSKLKELRSAKETRKNERRHRLQLLQEAKQKKLDEIAAAEAEDKLRQLSISEVSYPSTDEISALSPDEKADKNCDAVQTQDNSPETEPATRDAAYPCRNTEPRLDILQPIQVPTSYPQNSLLDDPDPLQGLKMNNCKIAKLPQYRNVETLTFKDFENDTSSPFDNVELKTINDMELLAQVLQSQRESTTSCEPQVYVPDHVFTIPNCASQAQIEGMTYLPNAYMEQPIQGPSMMYSPQHYPVSNGYYVQSDETTMQMDNANMYMQNYQYYVPSNPYMGVDPTYYRNQAQNAEISQLSNESTYIPEPYYFQYPQMQMQYTSPNVYATQNHQSEVANQLATSQNTMKSRSRSVPDIVNELNEELALAKRRVNERSYNASPAPKSIPRTSSSSDKKEEKRHRRKLEHLPNPFDKLSPKLQEVCKKIHGMGFPLDRVARVCTLVGDSDKKIIEGLLIMGQLMDLGFSEGRVSAVLAKHEFNRDKALDELVS